MFDFLNLKISEHDKQVMFGFADKSNRGELLPEEFAEAWEYLKQDINQVCWGFPCSAVALPPNQCVFPTASCGQDWTFRRGYSVSVRLFSHRFPSDDPFPLYCNRTV